MAAHAPIDRPRDARPVVLVVLVVLAIAAIVPVFGPTAVAGAASAYDFDSVDARLDQATNGAAEVSGAVLGVERVGITPGTVDILMHQGYGTSQPSSMFWTASAGKWFAGVTVMSVVDDGLISLDTTVGQLFPTYTGTTKGSITLRQLMSHTNGFGGGSPCMQSSTTTLAQCADEILALSLFDTPGTKFRYGGLGMQVAGRMIEVATGKTWTEVFNENVAQPLGLASSSYAGSTNPRIGGGTPGNGFRSDVSDYLRLLEMMLGHGTFRGTVVLSSTAFDTMTTDQTGGVPIASSPIPDMHGYGVALWIERVDALGRGTLFTSPGAFGMEPWIDTERGYAGVLAIQKDFPTGEILIDSVRPMLEQQIDTVPVGTPPPTPSPPVVSGLSATKGPVAGGQSVTITGTGFSGATAVKFSSVTPATSFVVVSDSTITAVSPARAAGPVNVLVTTPGGTSAIGSATLYTYVNPPTLTSLTPNTGSAAGGTVVTIIGTNFVGVTGVRFGPDTWASTFTVNSSTKITVTVPARSVSLVNVFVQAAGGLTATSSRSLFSYK